jgi:hypothetical protein
MEGSAPSEMKEETARRVRVGDVGAPATLDSFVPPQLEKQDDGDKPGSTGTLGGNRSGQAALRREQQEQLESSHCENRTTGRKVRPIKDFTSTDFGREEMAVHL